MTIASPLYDSLDVSREEIRVLDVVATEPHIICKLGHVALIDSPAYDALSYTWGNASKIEHITVNGHEAQVTFNLASAVRAVYHQWHKSCARSTPPRLWADALCINQADIDEKEHQIPLMRKIYTTADTVFVWLGTSAQALRESFGCISDLAIAERECFRLPEEAQKSVLRQWPITTDLSLLRNKIGILFADEYWTRVWTFQEITLGQNVALIGGTEHLAFDSLVLAEAFIRRYMEGVNAYGSDPQDNARLWFATRKMFQMLNVVFDIGEVKEAVAASITRLDSTREKLNFEDLSMLGFQLSKCCALAIKRRASHPKDFVYGFSAILDMQLIPDYSPTTSVASIYCDLMQQALSSGGNMCLQLLDSAGIGHEWDLLPGLPSWGPNFASVARSASVGLQQPLIKSNWASFVGLHDDRPTTIDRVTNSLFCTAILLDTVANRGPCLDHGSPNANWIQWLYDILLHTHSLDVTATIQLRPIIDAITKSVVSTGLFRPPTTVFGVNTCDYDSHNVLMLVFLLELLWDANPPKGYKELFLQALLCGTIDSWGKVTLRSVYQLLKNADQHYIELLIQEWSALCSTVKGLRLARTAVGHFGLFPPLILEDDTIAMINTCSNPAVLRKIGGCYTFVGWCHIMEYNERAVDAMVEAGLGKLERIEVR